jgi:endonuclease G
MPGANEHSSYLKRLARGRDLSDLLNDSMLAKQESMRATATESMTAPDVKGAFNAAQTGQSMNDAQRIATEAIIFPELRPAIDVVKGSYGTVTHKLWTHLSTDAAIKTRLETAIRRSGESIAQRSAALCGYRFRRWRRPMTVRYVAEIFANGLGDKSIISKAD